MFGLVTKSKVEKLQAQLASERINNSQLLDRVTDLERANKMLRKDNMVLFEKVHRPRNAKGQFVKEKR